MTHRKAVFVVDDDPSMLKGVSRLLRQYGFETVSFDTAKALRDHGDFGQAFCIVLDVNLSDGSGIGHRSSADKMEFVSAVLAFRRSVARFDESSLFGTFNFSPDPLGALSAFDTSTSFRQFHLCGGRKRSEDLSLRSTGSHSAWFGRR